MRYLSLCAIFKQENHWLDEWIKYHRGVGVEHIYLYSHDTDPFRKVADKILQPYVEEGTVEVIHEWNIQIPGLQEVLQRNQVTAYYDAIDRCMGKSVWIAFVDLDEFILPKQHDSICDILRTFEQYGGLAINWRVFGTSGYIKRPPSQINHLLHRANDDYVFNHWVKSIVQPSYVNRTLPLDNPSISDGGKLR